MRQTLLPTNRAPRYHSLAALFSCVLALPLLAGCPSQPDEPGKPDTDAEIPGTPYDPTPTTSDSDTDQDPTLSLPDLPPPDPSCCKICTSNSKPCGDACIQVAFHCSKGVGCACAREPAL